MKKIIKIVVLIFLIGIVGRTVLTGIDLVRNADAYLETDNEITAAVTTTAETTDGTDSSSFNGAVLWGEIVRVKDGDTFIVRVDADTELTVRLIGVDTPESVHPDESRNGESGEIASAFTKKLLPSGTVVRLEFDVDPTDDYGRTLAYAYLNDGRMIQDILLESGMARVMTIAPNVAFAEHFVDLQRAAEAAKVGFWADSVM